MAIVIRGSSLCPLCGNPMLASEDLILFPPFVSNEADPLWKFNDSGFHRICFERDPLSGKAESRWQEARERGKAENRRCLVCGRVILDPEEYFPLGHLADEPKHPLFRFNFAQFHQSCLPRWIDLAQVCWLAERQLESGAWKGKAMLQLVDMLKQTLVSSQQ
jgi:hypothetical protein